MTAIANSLAAVRGRIARACHTAGREPLEVRLIAVSKSVPPVWIAEALAAGQCDFGENYVQEALPKISFFDAAPPRERVTWHFIGPIQSNKTAEIAGHFDWVHGVDREKIARRLSSLRPERLPLLNVCVQVNISGEASKSGVAPEQALALCRLIATLPRLKLRGLMAIPAAPSASAGGDRVFPMTPAAPLHAGQDPRVPYRRLRELYESLRRQGLELDTLSAGMSDDFEAAIAEGSTLVRIGTAIFGARAKNRWTGD